jgi:hypothetical protein
MAQLAPVLEKLEDVAEPARQFYVPKDGKFHLDLSGAPAGFVSAADLAAANAKVVEFRDTNIGLKKTVDELTPLKAAFEGVDPKLAKEALAAQEELKKKGVTKPDDITNIVQAAVNAAVKPLTDQITTITTTAQNAQKERDALTLRSTLGEKFTKAGGEANALNFIVSQAAGIFSVENGVVKAAPNQFSADKPGEALSIDEWMTRQTKENAFAFKASSGSGADPAKGGSTTTRAGVIVIKNPTPQQLGQYGDDVRKGKVKFEYDSQ